MIALTPPALSGSTQQQLQQIQSWATTIIGQLQMILGNIQEENLSQLVRDKLNNQSEQTKKEIDELRAHIERLTAGR